jgi:hypothetical protein
MSNTIGLIDGLSVYDPSTGQVKDLEREHDGALVFRISHPSSPEAYSYGHLQVRSGGQVVFASINGKATQLAQMRASSENPTTPLTPQMERAVVDAEERQETAVPPKPRSEARRRPTAATAE